MNHGKMILEACVDSPESAEAAEKGGADRLELCGHLIIGGVTPDEWLYRSVREHCRLPVRVLIRPRFGDFCYTEAEFQMMEHQVAHFKKLGANAVVIGCLRPDGTLDLERMKRLVELAGDMEITLHRAFDVCKDPGEALEQASYAWNWNYTHIRSGEQCAERSGLSGRTSEAGQRPDYTDGRCGSWPGEYP